MSGQLDVGNEYINVDGQWVEKDALNIAERLYAIDPNVRVICVDPAVAHFTEEPFIIAELCPDGQYRPIFRCWELNDDVVERVRMADSHSNDLQARLEYMQAKKKGEVARRFQDRRDFEIDVGKSILKTRTSTFTYTDPDGVKKKVYSDGRPVEILSGD